MSADLSCFKAYDIRGRVPDQLNEDVAYRIGRAFAVFLKPAAVILGRDVRLSSPALADAVARGLADGGADVLDIGLCGTEEVYFATADREAGGGIMVTASHNPMDYNGMKLVREQARPISGDTGLNEIGRLAQAGQWPQAPRHGERRGLDDQAGRYVAHLLDYVQPDRLRPLKVVVNAGNGGAGRVIDLLEPHLPFDFVKVHHEPDGHFPNGIPNPLLPERRQDTIDAIRASGADLGLAWDGDFDRCFFFDEQGRFIEGYYIVGLLAQAMLAHHPGAAVLHDPRLTWNTLDLVKAAGGVAVQCKTGHAFIKERMRREDAVYGGEMSAHHYFRSFSYCDSGMIPWLLVCELLSTGTRRLSEMVAERMAAFPCSGELNFRVENPDTVQQRILAAFADLKPDIDRTDGVSLEFDRWRFNLRASNTEPLLRLNVETRGDERLLLQRTRELRELIGGEAADQ